MDHYGGNGLALKTVGETIRQLYSGDVAAFLSEAIATYGALFGAFVACWKPRLSAFRQWNSDLRTRLGIEREPISVGELTTSMAPGVRGSVVIEAIENLRRRSLVERGERAATFTLRSMVLEYMTDRLTETAADEIERGPVRRRTARNKWWRGRNGPRVGHRHWTAGGSDARPCWRCVWGST